MIYFIVFLFETIKPIFLNILFFVLSFLNMYFFRIRGTCISSIAGEYISLIIAGGIMLRIYIAGISFSSRDYTLVDQDKAIYTAIANTAIILGLTLLIQDKIQYMLSAILIGWHIYKGLTVAEGHFIIVNKNRWLFLKALKKELPVIIIICSIGILMDYITFKNGGVIPLSL